MKYGKFVPPTKYVLNRNPFFFLSVQFNAERKFCRESSFQWKKLSVVVLLTLPDLYRLHARRTLINLMLKTILQREDEAMAVVHF